MSDTTNIFFNNGVNQETFLQSLHSIPGVLNGATQIPFPASLQAYYNLTANNIGGVGFNSDFGPIPSGSVLTNLVPSIAPALVGPFVNGQQPGVGTLGNFLYTSLNQALQTLSQTPNSTPLTINSITAAVNTAANAALVAADDLGEIPINIPASDIYNGLLQDFATAMGIQLNTTSTAGTPNGTPDGTLDTTAPSGGGDWSIITNPAVNFSMTNTTTSNPFQIALNNFLSAYKFPTSVSSSPPFGYINDFINQFHTSLSSIATIQTATSSPTSPVYIDPSATPNPFLKLPSYEAYYDAFTPNATPAVKAADFKAFFNTFYQQQVALNGSFLPSQDFSAFTKAVNAANPNATIGGSSSVSGTDSGSALILNRIIQLLIQIIGTIQNVGIAQANNLAYLTKFQNAYTALLQEIPVFLADKSTVIGQPQGDGAGQGSQASMARNELNSSFNANLGDNLRALRSIQTNSAKTVQSNINTTNDSVNSDTGMITSILQEMSQLLGNIFK